jgi:phage FluMu protein Com
MKTIHCLFCNESLNELYDEISASDLLDTIAPCPRCGAALTFTTDITDVTPLLAQAVFDTDWATEEQRAQMEMLIHPGVDTLLDEKGGEVIGEVYLVVAWDPAEMLSTTQTGHILGVAREWVSQQCQAGAFPGATRGQSTRPDRWKQGRWKIPRQAVRKK